MNACSYSQEKKREYVTAALCHRVVLQGIALNDASICKMVALGLFPLPKVEARVDDVPSDGAGRENLDGHRERKIRADEHGTSSDTQALDLVNSSGIQIHSSSTIHQHQISNVVYQMQTICH
jgi:stage III sporulation protein SpoIIIAA